MATSSAHGASSASGNPAASEPLGHVTSVKLLVAVFLALVALTVATVAVTSIDLGSQWNLVAAMVIATLKAGLVVVFFMHLLWDKKFYLLIFSAALLFVVLFVSLSLNDRSEYQRAIDELEQSALMPVSGS